MKEGIRSVSAASLLNLMLFVFAALLAYSVIAALIVYFLCGNEESVLIAIGPASFFLPYTLCAFIRIFSIYFLITAMVTNVISAIYIYMWQVSEQKGKGKILMVLSGLVFGALAVLALKRWQKHEKEIRDAV